MGLKLPKNQPLGFYKLDKLKKQYSKDEIKRMFSEALKKIRDGHVPTIKIHRMRSNED